MSTLLQATNDVLKKTESIDSDGALASLSDSARQNWIDKAVQSINEVVDELYDLSNRARPNSVTTATITLVTGTRSYALASDVVRVLPTYYLVDRTNRHIIAIDTSEDAYARLIIADLEQDDTGLPSIAAVSPIDRKLLFDRAPTADHNGKIFTYYYEKDLGMSLAADVFPFTDPVYRAVVEAAQMKYEKLSARDFDERAYNRALSRAASRLSALPHRDTWDAPVYGNSTDPMEH